LETSLSSVCDLSSLCECFKAASLFDDHALAGCTILLAESEKLGSSRWKKTPAYLSVPVSLEVWNTYCEISATISQSSVAVSE